jgi:hypothetical protein
MGEGWGEGDVNRPWWQWRLDTDRENVAPAHIVCLIGALLGTSWLAAIAFWLGRDEPGVRGPAGAIGVLTAILSLGVSLWCSIRIRRWSLVGMVVLSCLATATWSWLTFMSFTSVPHS